VPKGRSRRGELKESPSLRLAPGGRFAVVPTYEITITGIRLAEPFAVTIEASDGREALIKLITKESTPLEAWAGEGFIELRLEKRRG
jgi:hypothetical protein